jgi:hypothetical protein
MVVAQDERREVLRFAGAFAAIATAVWAVLHGSRYAYQLEQIGYVYGVLNVGGNVLWGQILGAVYDPSLMYTPSAWAWFLATHFVAAFVQGLAYAFLWSVWRRSRVRASFYVLAISFAASASFEAGRAHFHKVNCSAPNWEGECDLAPIEGEVWAAVAFGLLTLALLAVEACVRRASRSASSGS